MVACNTAVWVAFLHARVQRGGGGGVAVGLDPPSAPEKSQKYRFLCIAGPDPLKNHKATKPAFNVGPSLARQRFKWRFAGGPVMARF